MAQKLIDKVAAVAGTASGIGLECARMMVSEGARGAGRPRRRGGASARSLARRRSLAVNRTDAADGACMMPQILDRAGLLDIFHANADAYTGGEVVSGDPDAWDRM